MFGTHKSDHAYKLQRDEDLITLITVGKKGWVSTPISPFLIISFIFSLAIPMMLDKNSLTLQVCWFAADCIIALTVYFFLTRRGRHIEKKLDNIVKNRVSKCAVIVRKEEVSNFRKSFHNDPVPLYCVVFKYIYTEFNKEILGMAEVPPLLYESLFPGKQITLNFTSDEPLTVVTNDDLQRYQNALT